MYLIINKDTNIVKQYIGNFPNLDNRLDNGENIIVISLYSDTVKTPYLEVLNGINEWNWSDIPILDYKSL